MDTSHLQRLDVAFKLAIAALASTGCEAAPSQNVLGSYFPSWMICAIGGLIAAAVLRKLLTLARMSSWLPAPVVVHLLFAVAFALGGWILWLD